MDVLTLDDLARLKNYTSRDGHTVLPGCYFVSVGGGPFMSIIRSLTQSEVGHAGMYVGNDLMVEGVPPFAVCSVMDSQPTAIFNYREGRDLSDEQRLAIVNKAHELVGTGYDFLAYAGFVAETLHLHSSEKLDKRYNRKHRVCSALVGDCMWAGGVDVDPFAEIVNLVSPKDLLRRITTY